MKKNIQNIFKFLKTLQQSDNLYGKRMNSISHIKGI
jgi:hypothetical protein